MNQRKQTTKHTAATKLPWFSRLLQLSARKWGRLILQQPRAPQWRSIATRLPISVPALTQLGGKDSQCLLPTKSVRQNVLVLLCRTGHFSDSSSGSHHYPSYCLPTEGWPGWVRPTTGCYQLYPKSIIIAEYIQENEPNEEVKARLPSISNSLKQVPYKSAITKIVAAVVIFNNHLRK